MTRAFLRGPRIVVRQFGVVLRGPRIVVRQFGVAFCLLACVFFLAGCSAGQENASQTPAAVTAQAEITAQSPAPETPAPTPLVQASVAASPPAQDSGPSASYPAERTTVADGFYYFRLTDAIKKRITGISFPADIKNAKITYDDLRYVRLKYYDFDGNIYTNGELIVNAALAKEVAEIFYALYLQQYAFTSIRLVDDYGEPGDDNLSMAANNTSAFNYRYVTGTKTLSQHSYGRAVDINPRINPYIANGRVSPANGAAYVDRSQNLPGMISHNDPCYQLFAEYGWKWGGDASDRDYQHFSKKQS